MIQALLTRPGGPRNQLAGLWALLVVVPISALPHAWDQPLWVTAVVVTGWLWRSFIHATHARLPSLWVLVVLVVSGGAATVGQFGTVTGQQAGTALLLVMIALKLLEIRSQRDIVVTLFLCYFLVATTYFFNQSLLIAGYSLVSAWLITAALIQVHVGRPYPLTRLARSSALMIAHALPIMLILFLVFPRIPGPIWGAPQSDPVGQTGLSERLEPGDIAQLLENENTAMRVRFEGPPPAPRQQYWRALVMSDFDGRGWRVDWDRPEHPPLPEESGGVSYEVMLEPTRARYLPLLDYPSRVPEQARLLDNLQAVSRQRLDGRVQYTGAARDDPPGLTSISEWERERHLRLPVNAAPRARSLADQWRIDFGANDSDIIQAALSLFAADPFSYTLRPPLLSGDRTDAFLFETRAGYCEHYASSFAVLMRAAGIPARVVTGFQGGQWMDTGNYLRLRYADAHAWNEIWLDGQGWVRIDPTAAIAPERIETGLSGLFADDADAPAFLRRSGLNWTVRWRLQVSDWHDLLTYRWEYFVLAFDPERQKELFSRFGLDPTDWRSVLIALVVAMGAVGAAAGLLAWLNRPRIRRDAEQRALDRLSRRLARIGLGRRAHETAEAYAARIREQRPDLDPMLEDFTSAYVRLRYAAPDPTNAARLQHQLQHALRKARMRI